MFEQPSSPSLAAGLPVGSPSQREIYTMPEQFVAKPLGSKSRMFFLIIGSLVVIAVLATVGGVFFFRNSKGDGANNPPTSPPANIEEPEPQPEPPSETPIQPEPEVVVPPTPEQPVPPAQPSLLLPSEDNDADNLTDLEEELLGTNPTKSDTDSDGYQDGAELISLYNPREPQGKKINDSGLVSVFTSEKNKWSVLYPQAWLAQVLDPGQKNVRFTAATGEFVEIIAQDNLQKQSLGEWYAGQSPDLDASNLQETVTKSNLQALWAPAGPPSVYLTKESAGTIYSMTYNIGTRTELNFGTIFKMMVESLTL